MEVQINPAEGFQLSDAIRDYVDDRLGRLDRHFPDRLTRVEVFLKDVNGPKGGLDKHCTMEARPRGLDPVVAEAQSDDAYASIKVASERLEKVLSHQIGRLTKQRRRG